MSTGRKVRHQRPQLSASDVLRGLLVFHLLSPTFASAYLDPITGSIVLQVVAAGFLAAAATFRKSREWISGAVRRITGRRGS